MVVDMNPFEPRSELEIIIGTRTRMRPLSIKPKLILVSVPYAPEPSRFKRVFMEAKKGSTV